MNLGLVQLGCGTTILGIGLALVETLAVTVVEGDISYAGPAVLDYGCGMEFGHSVHCVRVILQSSKVVLTYWNIGKYIAKEIDFVGEEKYGTKIVATVSQQLAERYGKGYTRTAVSRMVKIARLYNDEKMVATLSQQLTWSHFIELAAISQPNKRLFYQQMSIVNSWSVRQLRDQEDAMAYERSLIAAKPDDVHSVSKYALRASTFSNSEIRPALTSARARS